MRPRSEGHDSIAKVSGLVPSQAKVDLNRCDLWTKQRLLVETKSTRRFKLIEFEIRRALAQRRVELLAPIGIFVLYTHDYKDSARCIWPRTL